MKDWRIVIWTLESAHHSDDWVESFYADTKAEAYTLAGEHTNAYDVEIYGPDGFYDGVQ